MAEMNPSENSGRKGPGVKKSKKRTTSVDLTAMVDVCFLLIMFFIFTSQMESLQAMDLNMPKDVTDSSRITKVPASGALTILLDKDDKVFYYEGELPGSPAQIKETSHAGVREILIAKKNRTRPDEMMVIIKATNGASYKNTVDILDEMKINQILRYALTDIYPQETILLSKR